jgi:DNA-binding NtrC family response regulator
MVKDKPSVRDDAMKLLTDYDWPGNVRELRNVVQRLLFTDEKIVTPSLVKFALGTNWKEKDNNIIKEFFTTSNLLPLREMEIYLRQKYFQFVRENSESDTEAAKKLGLAPSNYHRMAKELGLK